jgi:hypothetical protein
MPAREDLDLSLSGLAVTDAATGDPRDVGNLRGTHVMVLMRHRH